MGGLLMAGPVAARCRGAAGFTFVETMVAMALLAFIVGDLAMVLAYAGRSSARAQRLAVAVGLAQSAVETARNTDFNNIDAAPNPRTDCFTSGGGDVACDDPLAYYARRRTVTVLTGGFAADVDVLLSWETDETFRISDVVSRY